MSIFTKRNALIGYVAVQALQRRRWQRRQHALKIAAFVTLGVVSAGILAALAAVVIRRQRETTPELEAEESSGWNASELDAEFHEPSFTA